MHRDHRNIGEMRPVLPSGALVLWLVYQKKPRQTLRRDEARMVSLTHCVDGSIASISVEAIPLPLSKSSG